ncbi:hypothetical protein VNO80_23756 [Phaseolus coccineus]|uniref:Uncharacterized protein n=1 Tax=Phaseolus coccineus TaxID=3886 RepID=A0AAN9M746_PHACN
MNRFDEVFVTIEKERNVIHEKLAEMVVRKTKHEDEVAMHEELRATHAKLVAIHSANMDMISETQNGYNKALAELRDIEVATQRAKARAAEDEVERLREKLEILGETIKTLREIIEEMQTNSLPSP